MPFLSLRYDLYGGGQFEEKKTIIVGGSCGSFKVFNSHFPSTVFSLLGFSSDGKHKIHFIAIAIFVVNHAGWPRVFCMHHADFQLWETFRLALFAVRRKPIFFLLQFVLPHGGRTVDHPFLSFLLNLMCSSVENDRKIAHYGAVSYFKEVFVSLFDW